MGAVNPGCILQELGSVQKVPMTRVSQTLRMGPGKSPQSDSNCSQDGGQAASVPRTSLLGLNLPQQVGNVFILCKP